MIAFTKFKSGFVHLLPSTLCVLISQVVLRVDKTHCTALVFVGLATTELGQLDQAYAAFTRATTNHSDVPLSWQVSMQMGLLVRLFLPMPQVCCCP